MGRITCVQRSVHRTVFVWLDRARETATKIPRTAGDVDVRTASVETTARL